MKHFSKKRLLLAAALALGLGSYASAQSTVPEGYIEKAPYFEDFENWSSSTFAPGWSRNVNSLGYDGSYGKSTSYGVDRSACVGNTSGFRGGSYPNYTYATDDFLVTPLVKGQFTFYAAAYNPTNSDYFITVYKLNKNADGTYSVNGNALFDFSRDGEQLEQVQNYKKCEYDLGDEYTYIGFRIIGAYIDNCNFEYALFPEERKVEISKIDPTAPPTVNANAAGEFPMSVTATIKNTGNVPIGAGTDSPWNLTLAKRLNSNGAPYIYDEAFASTPIPRIEPNATADVLVSGTYSIPEGATANDHGEIGLGNDFFALVDGYQDAFRTLGYVWVKPYKGMMNLRYDKNTSATKVESTAIDKPIYYGTSSIKMEKTFHISNSGPSTLTVTGVEIKKDGVDVPGIAVEDVQFPLTIASGGDPQDVVISISGEPGYKEATVKFLLDENSIPILDNVTVRGEIVPTGKYFDNFESGSLTWYAPKGSTGWTVGSYSSTERDNNGSFEYWPEYNINDKRLENTQSSAAQGLYSPKMSFTQGDKISFYAAKKSNNTSNQQIIVSYSPDRANWTELGKITLNNSQSPEYQFSQGTATSYDKGGQNILKRFEFTIPETGEYYINLNGAYVLVDNFVGGTLVEVPYDIVSESAEAGKTRTVNNPLTFSANFKNIASTEVSAEAQTVTLYANGQAVATATPEALPVNEEVTYGFSYVPHTAGETVLYADIAIGEYKVTSPTVTVKIEEESASKKISIGTVTATESSYVPLALNWDNSISEFVYTQEDLSELGASKILKISYPYYKTQVAHSADVVNIYMQNTDETEVGSALTDRSLMTQVAQISNVLYDMIGSFTSMEELVFTLDVPFEYDGRNLRVVIESLASAYKTANFGVDKGNGTRKSLYKHVDNGSTGDPKANYQNGSVSTYNGGLPVINMFTELPSPQVSGTVTKGGAPVVGATVRATATEGDVYYETVTGEQGEWSITIFQSELDYTLTVTIDGKEVYSGNLDKEGANNITLEGFQIPEGHVEVPGYIEHFSSNSVKSNRLNVPTDPFGWNVIIGDKNINGSDYKVSYTATSSGKEGYCIGQTSNWEQGPYSGPKEILMDYIITPLVKGDLKFYLKRYQMSDSYPPEMILYTMTKQEDGTFTCDPENDVIKHYTKEELSEQLANTSTWYEFTENIGDDYEYVGIRMRYIYFDEFSATSAILPIKKELELGASAFSEGYSYKVNATADGKWKIGANIKVTNASNIPLLAAEQGEDYTISLVRVKSTSNPYTWTELKTVSLPDMQVGEEKTVEIEGEFEIPEDVELDKSYGYYRFRVDFVENFTGKELNKSLSSWVEVTPYESILDIRYDKKSSATNSTDTQVDPTKPINFGSFRGEREYTFRLRNRGAATMTGISYEAPEGVTVVDLPETIEAGATATIKVKVAGEPGLKEGVVKFTTDGIAMVDEIAFTAEVIGENEFFSNFEGEEGMNAWFTPDNSSNWKVADYASGERTANDNYYPVEYGFNDKRLENTMQTPLQHIYSPKLAFEEGDEISFYAAKKTNNGSDVKLVVRYSPDRTEWTELGTITVTNEDHPELQFSSGTSTSTTSNGQNILKRFSFEMPEGEYYISLGAGYVLVDNFHGGTLVDIDYDIAPISAEVGKTKMINNPLDFTATFRNLLSEAVPAEDQTVSLYANGEVVATATAKELAAATNVAYEFSYVPHVTGETELYAEIAIGEYTVESAHISVYIQEESSITSTQIGEMKTNDSNIPLYLSYNNSRSEVVYTAEMLSQLKGNRILQISYPYYKSGENIKGQIKIWMENTTDENVGGTLTNTEDWTPVAEIAAYDIVAAGSKTDPAEMIFPLDIPFDYEEGKNLRVIIEKMGTDWKSCDFMVDNTVTGTNTRYYNNDTQSTYESNRYGAGSVKNNTMPVINIYTAMDIAPVTGTVMTSNGDVVMGATVKAVATEGDVYYETTTNALGGWSLDIYQMDLDYTVTATSEEYGTTEPVALNKEGSNDLVFEVAALAGTFTVTVFDSEDFDNTVEGVEVTLFDINNADDEGVTATTDEDGDAAFNNLPFGEYKIVVSEEQGLLIERFESEMAVDFSFDGAIAEIWINEIVIAPTNGSYTAAKNTDNAAMFDITLNWSMTDEGESEEEGEETPIEPRRIKIASSTDDYTFNVYLDGEQVKANHDDTTYTIEGVIEDDHVVKITSVSPSGKKSEELVINIVGDTLYVMSIGGEDGNVRYFNLNGIEIHSEDVENGIYIRVIGNKAERVLIKK